MDFANQRVVCWASTTITFLSFPKEGAHVQISCSPGLRSFPNCAKCVWERASWPRPTAHAGLSYQSNSMGDHVLESGPRSWHFNLLADIEPVSSNNRIIQSTSMMIYHGLLCLTLLPFHRGLPRASLLGRHPILIWKHQETENPTLLLVSSSQD